MIRARARQIDILSTQSLDDRSGDFLDYSKNFLLLWLMPRYPSKPGYPRSERLHRLFVLRPLGAPKQDGSKGLCFALLYTGCQCLNRSLSRLLDEPSVLLRFTAKGMVSVRCRFRRYSFSHDPMVQGCTPIHMPYTTSQINDYGWWTGRLLIVGLTSRVGKP